MPDYLGDDQRKIKEEEKGDAPIRGKCKNKIKDLEKDAFLYRNVDISYLANASSARLQTLRFITGEDNCYC